jgi:hypothetical protein
MTTRNPVPPLKMPPYEFEEVQNCASDLSSSLLIEIEDRNIWLQSLAEMLLLCNESANRRMSRFGNQAKLCSDGTQTKPLGLEYMADRIDIDDPLRGYQVNNRKITLSSVRMFSQD